MLHGKTKLNGGIEEGSYGYMNNRASDYGKSVFNEQNSWMI